MTDEKQAVVFRPMRPVYEPPFNVLAPKSQRLPNGNQQKREGDE